MYTFSSEITKYGQHRVRRCVNHSLNSNFIIIIIVGYPRPRPNLERGNIVAERGLGFSLFAARVNRLFLER